MSEQQERRLPTWQELYDWTCSKPEEAIVGYPGLFTSCPIAQYQRERYGEMWSVSTSFAYPTLAVDRRFHPDEWMCEVINRVDRDEVDELTATDFKAILEQERE